MGGVDKARAKQEGEGEKGKDLVGVDMAAKEATLALTSCLVIRLTMMKSVQAIAH